MNKLKILLVSPLPPPVGGIATWTKHILKSLEYNECCELLHYDTAMKNRRITQLTVFQRILSGVQEMRRHIPLILQQIKEQNIQLAHITSSASLGIFRDYILLSKLNRLNIKSVIHFRFGRIPELARTKNWEWKMLCKVVNKASKVIVIDKNSYEVLINTGFKNIAYLPNPIAEDIESQQRGVENVFANRVDGRILFVGHVTPNKGVLELVEACAASDKVEELILVGPYEPDFNARIKAIAFQRDEGAWLNLKGIQDKKVVLENMKKCQLFVLPSYTEGFPNVILEAMIMGCPIIATSVGAIEDMLNIQTDAPAGICILPRNAEDLKNAIEKLFSELPLAEKMGERAKDKVLQEYTISVVKNRLVDLWMSIV